jgi:hypothetical protein
LEKTLTIDGQKVKFKCTGGTPLRYKAQFQKDFLVEMMKLNLLGRLDFNNLDPSNWNLIDYEPYYHLVWALAKTADDEILDPIPWLDQFESFPILKIAKELQEVVAASIQVKKK